MKHVKNNLEDYYLDDYGNRHGEYKAWYTNGQLRVHCHYDHGEHHGEFKAWYTNGSLSRHCHYVDDERHGEYKSWHYDGQLSVHTYEVNDEVMYNLLENPLSDEEKFELQLTHGGKWLCNM